MHDHILEDALQVNRREFESVCIDMNASIQEVFETAEKPLSNVSAQTLFGEPIEAQGKTIVPVAKLSYRVMGGGGSHGGDAGKDGAMSGAGGRIRGAAVPFGALEITSENTRFVPFFDVRKVAGIAMLGFIFGSIMAGRRK